MRFMAIGAHPDDVEVQCAGTLARCAELGHEAIICVATNGAAGSMVIKPPELARIREREARAAAELLGAEFIWLGYPDEFLLDSRETRLVFVDAIRQGRPDVIITHSPEDYHPDHVRVSQLVFDASFVSSVPSIETTHPSHPTVPPIYYMDTPTGKGFLPTDYVDITASFETKRRMMACHESQITWLKDHDNMDILEFIEIVALARGLQCGVRYAEGFRRADVWPRTPPRRLLP
jgi:LmbE family N-acetylglucosaminyl deacetylase